MADGVSELERQLNELSGALDLLFELREEFAQWVEEAADGSKRSSLRKRSWPYRSIGERIPESPRRTAEEGEVRLAVWSLTADISQRDRHVRFPPKADMWGALAHVR